MKHDDYSTVREALETTLPVAIEQGDDPHKVADVMGNVAALNNGTLLHPEARA